MDPLVGAVKKSKHCNGYAAVELEELVIVVVGRRSVLFVSVYGSAGEHLGAASRDSAERA